MPISILIIDDSAIVRRTLRRLLTTKPGWTVCGEAPNGEEGVRKAKELNPDAIVLDMSMPELDGLETAAILKRLLPEVPLIMFTNFSKDQFLKRELMWAGIWKVVSKTDSTELVKALEAAFGPPETSAQNLSYSSPTVQ